MRLGINFPKLLVRASFFLQLAVTFTLSIVCLALLSSLAITTLSTEIVRENLVKQGRQATEAFASQSVLALLYFSPDNAEEPARAALAFPDVRGVGIYNLNHEPLLVKGEVAQPEGFELDWSRQLAGETDKAWYFVAPVLTHRSSEDDSSPFGSTQQNAEQIGFVRLTMAKDTLKTMESSILRTNLTVSGGFTLVFLPLLLAFAQRLVNPLKHLAVIMGRAAAGEKNLLAKARGPKDIVDMETAFNTMMSVLERRERQLEKARDAALESARLKGEFAANVSHELRTPLNAVLGMLELLRDMGLTAKQLEYVDIAGSAGESLLRLIEDILDFSRIEAGMMRLYPVDFVVHEVLDDVTGLLKGQARRKRLALNYEIGEDVPVSVHGESSRIRQVLVNLVGNAIKFTEQGSIDIRVSSLRTEHDGNLLRFEVADTGIGIPAEIKEDIFEAFVQADGSSTRRYEGTGLGLAICRQLVALMGGEIGVESKPGSGSRFWFDLPLQNPKHLTSAALGKAPSAPQVLVVSTDETAVDLIARILGSRDVACKHVTETPEALEMLRNNAAKGEPYQLAVIDQAALGASAVGLIHTMAQDMVLAQTRIVMLADKVAGGNIGLPSPSVVWRLEKPLTESEIYGHVLTACKEAAQSPRITRPPAYLGSRILVVEDNRANQEVAIGMLERLGCDIDVAGTGADALQKAGNGNYDLILMDCHMPVMDGYEATRRIRGLPGAISLVPIVAMTANTQKGDSERCLAAGMDDYLAKPLKLNPLRDKLYYWLGGVESEAACGDDAGLSPNGTPRALNELTVQRLHEEIGEGFGRMARIFFEDTPAQLETLRRAGANGNATLLFETAHSLKGAALNLGANRLADYAKQLEDMGRAGATQKAEEVLVSLREEHEAVTAELSLEMDREAGQSSGAKRGMPTVLIADDDRAMRNTLYDLLQKDGYHIELASSGVQALSICERHMPDLLLLDAMMPEADGFTVCSRLRQRPENAYVPIIIVTSLNDEDSIDRAFSAGATDYVPKPVHFAVLRQRVARLLEASRAEERLNRLAFGDVLTGLPNRAMFLERLNTLLAGAEDGHDGAVHAVLFLDLDRFKLANDTLGHEIGDRLLQAVSERIQNTVRKGDLVARFGGDEFTLLLENIRSPQVAAEVSQKICQAMAKPFSLMGYEAYIGTSIGISIFPADGADSVTLIKYADIAMYRAKEHGNTYRFYEKGMDLEVSTLLRLEGDLRRALENDEFFLHYQPQFDIKSGGIVGMEALVRWMHPERGLIPPLDFIASAEKTGLIEPLGEWVLRSACKQNLAWQQAGLPRIPVAVNISARQFEEAEVVSLVESVLRDTGLEPQYLELELTESAVMRYPEISRDSLLRLRQIGVRVSIDDFGTGYSSLSQLKYFPFDKLKIDKSFINDVINNPDGAAIVRMIIAIGNSLNLKVIAEGVETEEQLSYLREQECDEVQGYYFSKPLPVEEAKQLLETEVLKP